MPFDRRRRVSGPGSLTAPSFGVVLLLGFCGGDPPEVAPDFSPTLAPLPERDRLYFDDSGGIQDSMRLVIRDPERWAEVWERATARRASPPQRPAIDFSRHMVVLVAAGLRGAEDRIRVDSVGVHEQLTPSGDRERVFKVIVRTVDGCPVFEADVYPVEIVRVPAFDGPVAFEERTARSPDCTGSGDGPTLTNTNANAAGVGATRAGVVARREHGRS